MAAFYGTPQFRGFDLNSILNPQAGDEVAGLLEQSKRKGFMSKSQYPGMKTLSMDYTPPEVRREGYEIQRPQQTMPRAPMPAAPPAPPPDAAIPTWQSMFSDAERAGVTGQNTQGSLGATTGGTDLSAALGAAAKIFGQRKEKKDPEPIKFAPPAQLRSSPITQGLPDPVLFALFGKPI